MRRFVAHSEFTGDPLAFSVANHLGNVPSRAQV